MNDPPKTPNSSTHNIIDSYYAYPLPGRLEAGETSRMEDPQKRFDTLANNANQLLLNISAVFPFDFFPDQITVDAYKVNIIRHNFLTKKVHSIFVRDISDIVVYKGILFSSLTIIDSGYTDESIVIKYLWSGDAMQARKVIQGLVVSSKQGVDLSKVDLKPEAVEAIGEAKGAE